jgi:hypothetical protein
MKKIVLVLVSLLMIFCLASCNKNEPSTIVNKESSVEVNEPFISVSVTKDANGNILQHILFNKHTKVTYIYDYEWVYDYGAYVCSGSWLTVIDAEGNEVPDEPQVSVNGSGNSGDVYNDVYPGYKVPEYQGSKEKFVPVKIFNCEADANDPDVSIYITDVEYNTAWKAWIYKVKIVNNESYDITVELTNGIVDNKPTQLYFGFNKELDGFESTEAQIQFVDKDGWGITDFTEWAADVNIYNSSKELIYSKTIFMDTKE